MNKKAVAWLYKELPGLAAKGVISQDTAEKIKAHYGPVEDKQSSRTFLLLFGIIGVFLIGLGIILLIAHNLPQLTRLNRLAISVGMLAAAQLIAGAALYFKQDSPTWRETTATFQMLIIGASIALVGQTYHLTDASDYFWLTWMFLSLPIIYIMRSTSVAALYTIGITVWSSNSRFHPEIQLVWLMLLFALPYYRQVISQEHKSNAAIILTWIANICFYFWFSNALGIYLNKLSLLVYSALFAMNYFIGVLWFNSEPERRQMPFQIIGLAGTIGLVFMASFNSFWQHNRLDWTLIAKPENLGALLLALLVIAFTGYVVHKTSRQTLPFSAAFLVISAAYLITSLEPYGIGATILMNSYMLILSLFVISIGISQHNLTNVNIGMAMISILIIARFFDMNFSFAVRGVIFLVLGLSFLLTNFIMVRNKARRKDEK